MYTTTEIKSTCQRFEEGPLALRRPMIHQPTTTTIITTLKTIFIPKLTFKNNTKINPETTYD
jgi:hypothetical protein